jgi:hypothetical protein
VQRAGSAIPAFLSAMVARERRIRSFLRRGRESSKPKLRARFEDFFRPRKSASSASGRSKQTRSRAASLPILSAHTNGPSIIHNSTQVERVVPNALEPLGDKRFHQFERGLISVQKLRVHFSGTKLNS